MVFHKNVVVCIKVNGQILREHQNNVVLPFGSEYSILVKNLNACRIKTKILVDGIDATEGTWLVVDPNSSLDLERFIKGGDFDSGRRFKFIERTKEIEQHRGIKADDGLVRVEYRTELVRPVVPVPHYEPYDVPYPVPRPYPKPWYPKPWPRPYPWHVERLSVGASSGKGAATRRMMPTSCDASNAAVPDVSDVGITVPGSVSNQRFHSVSGFETGESDVIVLHLHGAIGQKTVKAPITVKFQTRCETCGAMSKSGTAEFCSRCGTALTL